MRLRVLVEVELAAVWEDADLSLADQLAVMHEEFPSVAALLGDAMAGGASTAHVELSCDGETKGRRWGMP